MNTTQHIHVHETTSHMHVMDTTTTTPHIHVHGTTTTTPHMHIQSTTTTAHIHVHDTTTMDHSMHGNTNTGHDMMSMFFHGGYKEIVLFDFWRTSNVGIFILSCFILFAISILYEGLKLLRHKMLQRELRNEIRPTQNSINGPTKFVIQENAREKHKILTTASIIQALLYMLQAIISYALMMVFMTFNVWLCLSLVLGAGVGYVLFGHRRYSNDFEEHCN